MGCRLWGRTELDMTEAIYQDRKETVTPLPRVIRNRCPSYLCHPLHRLLLIHLQDAILCCAGHTQLVPVAQGEGLFTPVEGRSMTST